MINHNKFPVQDISNIFTTEWISKRELASIIGGIRRKGKSRDKDHLDLDDI